MSCCIGPGDHGHTIYCCGPDVQHPRRSSCATSPFRHWRRTGIKIPPSRILRRRNVCLLLRLQYPRYTHRPHSLRLHLFDSESKSFSLQSISFSPSSPRSGISADERRFCFSLHPLPVLCPCHSTYSDAAFVYFFRDWTRTRLDTDHCTDGRQNTQNCVHYLGKKKVAARVQSR